jgi:hypothetical protein
MMNFKPQGLVATRRPSILLRQKKPRFAVRLEEGGV